MTTRYRELADQGLLHIMQVIRDLHTNADLEVLGCTADDTRMAEAH